MKTTYVKSLGVDSLLTRIQLSLETRRHWAKSMLNYLICTIYTARKKEIIQD